MVGTAIDMTEQKQTELHIESLSRFLDENPNPILRIDANGSIIYANKASTILLDTWNCQTGDLFPDQLCNLVLSSLKSGSKTQTEIICDRKTFSLEIIPFRESLYADIYGLDISERKFSEAALKESEDRYRIIADNTYDWEFWLSPEGEYLFTSPSCERITGYKAGEFAADKNLMTSIIHPEDQPLYHKHFRNPMGKIHPDEIDFRILHRDGTIRWLGQICLPIYDSGGRYLGIRGSNRDITERKRAEEELKLRNILLTAQQEASIDGILIVDDQDKILLFNKRFTEMWRLPDEVMEAVYDRSVLGKVLDKVLNPKKFLDRVKFLYEHRNKIGQDQITLKDGRIFERYSAPMFGADDKYYGRVWYFRDITARNQAEHALRESRELYENLAEKSLVGVYVVQDGKFKFINSQGACLSGYLPDELLEQDSSMLIHQDDRDHVRESAKKMLHGEQMSPYEFRIVTKQGDHRWIMGMVTAIQYGNRPAILGNTMDITEQKKTGEDKRNLEKQLRQAQKMEAIGTLASGIAHDFNNILGAISGYTEMAMEETARESSLYNYLEQIFKGSKRAIDLVRQILAFSRQSEQELRPISFDRITKETLKLMRATLPSTIRIIHHLESDHDIVLADPGQIQQVLMNLCTNAADAMRSRGGTLEVNLVSRSINAYDQINSVSLPPGSYLELSVKDDGEGIPPDIIDRVFDPFFTTKNTGTGMGLSVVHGIIKNHGGEITVESDLGHGSIFRVYLPSLEVDLRPIEQDMGADLPRGREKILFVDDEEILVKLGQVMLAKLGYDVDGLSSSSKALDVFRTDPGRYDLVITDMTMPGMTGVELAQELLSIRQDLPIILCTGFHDSISPVKAKQLGFREFVLKPILMQQIAGIIRRILDQPF
jgi:PAS domain S-box-containing protein